MRPPQRAAFQRTLVHSARTDIWDIFLVDHELAIFHVLHVRYTDALNMRIVWQTQYLKPLAEKSMRRFNYQNLLISSKRVFGRNRPLKKYLEPWAQKYIVF